MSLLKTIVATLVLLLLCFACQLVEPPKEKAPLSEIIKDTVPVPLVKEKNIATPKIVIDYDTTQWTDIRMLDSTIFVDMKYATTDNFVTEKMYECSRCFLRPEVAKQVVQIHHMLKEEGLALRLYDCFRPRPIQWKLWEKVPDPRYVSDPRKGSMHNRGAAVDLTIAQADGTPLEMGTGFDYFGKEAYHTYTNLPDSVLQNRNKLKGIMEENGFRGIRTEWWHYSYTKQSYPLSDMLWNCPD
ncbi:MAG: M15 family metallopeptidase [Bacteroidota bacterium]